MGPTREICRLARKVPVPWASILPSAIIAAVFAYIGARTVTAINPDYLKPIILILLIAVAGYTLMRKNFGAIHQPKFAAQHERFFAVVIGITLGFYEGFFGRAQAAF